MKIEVFTDGSATIATKPGGWAYVITVDGLKYAECSGHMPCASNNDAEMEAAIQGLAAVLKYLNEQNIPQTTDANGTPYLGYTVSLCSDSQLILGWASGNYRFKQTEKMAKYHILLSLMKRTHAGIRWVRGHNGDEHNERCDKLANAARLQLTHDKKKAEQKLKGGTLIGTKKLGTICVWYKDSLKVIDLETNMVEDYKREKHGARGSILEIREEKTRERRKD